MRIPCLGRLQPRLRPRALLTMEHRLPLTQLIKGRKVMAQTAMARKTIMAAKLQLSRRATHQTDRTHRHLLNRTPKPQLQAHKILHKRTSHHQPHPLLTRTTQRPTCQTWHTLITPRTPTQTPLARIWQPMPTISTNTRVDHGSGRDLDLPKAPHTILALPTHLRCQSRLRLPITTTGRTVEIWRSSSRTSCRTRDIRPSSVSIC